MPARICKLILSQTKPVVKYEGQVFLVVIPDKILTLILCVDLDLGVIGFTEPYVSLSSVGLETTLSWYPTDRFRIDASYSKNDTELQDDVWLSDLVDLNDPDGQDDQLGAKGQELAIAPPSKWWIGLDYTIPDLFSGLDAWIRYDHTWSEGMYHDWWNAMNAQIGNGGKKLIGDASEGSLQFSIGNQGSWSLTFSIWNIWDDRTEQWVYSGYDGYLGETGTFAGTNKYVNMPGYVRPREFELRFKKDFKFD